MKIKSNLDIVNARTKALHNKKANICKVNKSIQATRSTLHSKNKPVSFDNDTFSIFLSLESYLKNDINHFKKIGLGFDKIDKEMKNTIKVGQ